MGLGAHFFGAGRGSSTGADLGSLDAATAGVASLKQAVEERRLAAKIANPEHDWRAVLEVGPLAAPLWLADTLVWLAQTFYGAEADARQDHPDHPAAISPTTHQLISALLAPIEDIIADVTAALADPTHRTRLTTAAHVGPGTPIAGDELPHPISLMYVNGLAKAARGVHTSAMSALAETRAALAQTTPPDWLAAGLQRLDGMLQAAGARLDMIEIRLPSLVMDGRDNRNRQDTLATICADLWSIVDTTAVAGQQIADPHIMSEARTANIQRVAPPQQAQPKALHTTQESPSTHQLPHMQPDRQARQIAPGEPPSPLRAVRPQPAPSPRLPEIAEGSPFTSTTPTSLAPNAQPSSTTSPLADAPLPTIGAEPETQPTTQSANASSALPHIGGDAPAPTTDTPTKRSSSMEADDTPSSLFPDIG